MKLLRGLLFLAITLVTLFALFHAVENWRGKRMWRACLDDAARRGQVLDLRALVKPSIPDSENFAAIPVVRAWFAEPRRSANSTGIVSRADLLVSGNRRTGERSMTDLVAFSEAFAIVRTNGRTKVVPAPRTEAEQAQAARVVLVELAGADSALAEFRAAENRPSAKYPVEFLYDEPFAILLPHLRELREVLRTLNLRASAGLAAGDSNSAFADIMLSLRIVESLRDEPFLISELVRIASLHLTMQPVWEGFVRHRWSADQCAKLQARLESMNFPRDIPLSLQVERAAGIATIETIRRNRLHPMYIDQGDHSSFAGLAIRLAPSGWFYMEKANYARVYDDLLSAVLLEPFDPLAVKKLADAIDISRGGAGAILSHRAAAALLMPAFGNVAVKVGAAQTAVDQLITACALERFRLANGSYPESLGPLVPAYLKTVPRDLFARMPMKYMQRAPDSYVLYSIGANGKDDGGMPGRQPWEQRSGDWVWSCP